MRHTTKIQSLTLSSSAELTGRLPYQTPQCRVFTFRGGDLLSSDSGGDEGDIPIDPGTTTGNSGEGTGHNGGDSGWGTP